MKQTGKIWNSINLAAVFLMMTGVLNGQSGYDQLLKAGILVSDARYSDAVSFVNSIPEAKRNGKLYYLKGEAELRSGDVNGAISDFTISKNMGDPEADFGLARAYASRGDAATSLQHLENNLKSSARKSEKEIMLDQAFSRIENKPEWRAFWKKDWFTGKEKMLAEIEYYTSAGKAADAMSSLTELENSYRGSAAADYASALVSFTAGKYPDALKTIVPLASNDPTNEKYLRLLARIQEAAANPAGASDSYSKLIELQVPDAGLLISRAECYRKTGETDKARADIKRYLDLAPDSKSALSIAGKIESASGNNLEAIGYFTRNLKLHPNDPDCYIDRANSYLLSKSWEWAAKDYSMALDLSPGNADTWLNKGLALVNSGKAEDACHDFRQALSLGSKRASDLISRYCIK